MNPLVNNIAPAGNPLHGTALGVHSSSVPVPVHKTVIKAPSDLSPELSQLVTMLQAYGTTNTWEGMRQVLSRLDEDAYYDHPLIYIQGRERIRVLSSLLALMVEKEVDPKVVRLQMTDNNRAEMDVDTTCRYVSARYWWLPLTYLVPAVPNVQTTQTIIVKGWNNRISHLSERFHNLPALPYFLRYIVGWTAGTAAVLLEPLIHSIINFAEPIVEKVQEVVDPLVERAAEVVEAVKEKVADVTGLDLGTAGTGGAAAADGLQVACPVTGATVLSSAVPKVGSKEDLSGGRTDTCPVTGATVGGANPGAGSAAGFGSGPAAGTGSLTGTGSSPLQAAAAAAKHRAPAARKL
ncbi:MAG: hypothetical protein WDW36_002612 [Sanguina aurantia]